jgi:ketosteroid isomerase-like protein
MRRLGTLAVAVAALAVSGCGGESDKEKVATTVRDYFTAFADSDFDRACDKLAEHTREDLVKAAHTKDCPAALARGAARADVRRFKTKLRDARVESVDIKDQTATAKVRALGATTNLPLVKEGDAWKVQATVGEGETGGE